MTHERKLFDDDGGDATKPNAPPPDSSSDASRPKPVGAPHNGSQTSREAAERIAPVSSAQAARVLVYIAQQGDDGATDHEVQTALGLTGDSERPRRWSLQRAGLIRDSGQRRKSPAGRAAIVWIATEAALPAAVASPQQRQAS